MKDGRPHLAHKAEQAVALETGAVVGVTLQGADTGDTTTLVETLIAAAGKVEAVQPDGSGIEELVGDKGYYSNQTVVDCRPWDCAATSRSRTGAAGAGRGGRRPATPSMPTGAGSAGRGAVACCGPGGNCWSGRLRICSKPAGCGGCIFAGIRTS